MPDVSGKHIVDTAWLAANLAAPDLVVLDGSWHLPAEKRDPRAEYRANHIPGARFFDIDDISDDATSLPHMLPPPEKFAAKMQALGVGAGDCVVAYDASAPGLFSAARVWWMFRAFGHANVAVLDGGLKKWKAEGRASTADAAPARPATPLSPRLDKHLVASLEEMRALVAAGSGQIVDARAAGRFEGREPEPRPGVRSGHIPGARSIPFPTLLNADGRLKSMPDLRRVFEAAGIDLGQPVVTSCGSGVTAAVLSLALALVGRPDTGLYDGSWSEWGQASLGTPIATGTH